MISGGGGGGACNIHFCFSLIHLAIAAKHCIKLDIPAISLFYLIQFATFLKSVKYTIDRKLLRIFFFFKEISVWY